MKKAILLAKQAKYRNPYNLIVGCVIVKNNKIIGEGYYDSLTSKDHAETKAFKNAKEDVSGASLYITLEPCFHIGKTPPCVDRIISHNIKEVIIPFKDPNPLVNGKSILKLKSAGINVITDILAEESYNLNEEFFYYHLTKKPLVTAKWASSLDGKLATYNYNSKWITNEHARKKVHIIRGKHKAILVGSNTLNLDNPLLNIRYNIQGYTNPIRIILAQNSNINFNAALWNDNSAPNWLILPNNYINDANIKNLKLKNFNVIGLPLNEKGFIDFDLILKILGEKGISSLLIEGGPNTLSNVLEKRLINKLEVFISPIIMGGNVTVANFINEDVKNVCNAEKFKITNYNLIKEEIVWLSLTSEKHIDDKKQYIEYLKV